MWPLAGTAVVELEIRRGGGSTGDEAWPGSTREARATWGWPHLGLGWPGRGSPAVAEARRRRHSGDGERWWLGGRASGGQGRAS
jgi:hypothetical protein